MEKCPAVAFIGLNRSTLWSLRVHMRAINVIIVQIFKLIKINSQKSRPQQDSLQLFATVVDWRIFIFVTSAGATSPQERSSSLLQADDERPRGSKYRKQEKERARQLLKPF